MANVSNVPMNAYLSANELRIETELNGSRAVNTDLQGQSPFIRLGKS